MVKFDELFITKIKLSQTLLLTECFCPLKFICQSCNSPYRCIRDRAFKEVIKVKWGHKDGALIQWHWCPYKRHQGACSYFLHNVRTQPGRVLTRKEPCWILIWNFQQL